MSRDPSDRDPEYVEFFAIHGDDKIDVNYCNVHIRISIELLYQMFKQRYDAERAAEQAEVKP